MYYKVQVATDTAFQYVVWSGLVIDDSTSIILKNLQYSTTYYWRVKAIDNVYGAESDWSSYCTFITKGQDITYLHTTTNIYFQSMRNLDIGMGIKCRVMGQNLNNFRIDKNYPIVDVGACHFLSQNMSDLLNRNVG